MGKRNFKRGANRSPRPKQQEKRSGESQREFYLRKRIESLKEQAAHGVNISVGITNPRFKMQKQQHEHYCFKHQGFKPISEFKSLGNTWCNQCAEQ